MATRSPLMILLLPVSAAFTMPFVDLNLRRLILVRTPAAASAVSEIAAHVIQTHGDEVRYMMADDSEVAIETLDRLFDGIQPKTVGRLATSSSTGLRAMDSTGSISDAAFRSLEARDYILRGTLDGRASLLIAHESVIKIILMRAADLECDVEDLSLSVDPVADVSVLDFGVGSYPWQVADEPPKIRPKWSRSV